jgi:hypothetical protein
VHKHAEAFTLMTYVSDDGTETERVWNSRDGVTPFVITLRSGKTATHRDWAADEYLPNYVPPAGSRVFVDLTPELARKSAAANVARWRADAILAASLSELGATEAEQVDRMTSIYLRQPGGPTLVDAETLDAKPPDS